MRLQLTINKLLFVLAGCCVLSAANGQRTFKYQAAIKMVDSAGFYKIELPATLIAKSKGDLSDIRLADTKGAFIPFITGGSLPQPKGQRFLTFAQVNFHPEPDTGTTFTIDCKGSTPVNNLWLKLNNTAVQRTVNLSGSDDLKKWFAIEEDVPLQTAVASDQGTYLQSLSFPASSYRYLKLLVNDKHKAPIDILAAGVYEENKPQQAVYETLPAGLFTAKNSDRLTYVSIRLKDSYLVNLIRLKIAGPRYYLRDAAVYSGGRSRGLICSTQILSAGQQQISLSAKESQLQLQIYNGDNPPLKITGIELLQAPQFITAYLEPNKHYQILTGDPAASTPVYDLAFFRDSIHNELPVISTFGTRLNPIHNTAQVKAGRNVKLLIWIAIGAALLVLLALTRKMMTEVSNKTTSD